jgi:hypothetical protein
MTTTGATVVRFLGTTDEVAVCDCCGRKDLKSTVALSIDEGEPVYYGVTCAARALARPVAEVKRETKRADDAKAEAERARREAEHKAFMARWEAFLATAAPSGHDVFTRIEALGGMKRARELFAAAEGQ